MPGVLCSNQSVQPQTESVSLMIIIKQLDNKRVDVFTGQGWDQWSRFSVEKGFPQLLQGAALSDEDYKELKNALVQRKVRR